MYFSDGYTQSRTADQLLIVVPCGAAKQDRPAPAAQLYTGAHFRFVLSAAVAEAADTTRVCGHPAAVAILSARFGLLALDTVIAPYDLRMGQPGSVTAERVAAQLAGFRPSEITTLLPAAYLRVLADAITIANTLHGADIVLNDAYESAPGIGYQRGVAASLLRTAGRLPVIRD